MRYNGNKTLIIIFIFLILLFQDDFLLENNCSFYVYIKTYYQKLFLITLLKSLK